MARLIFLDPEIHDLFCAGGWSGAGLVAALRVRYGRGKPEPRVEALISDLVEGSPLFKRLWEEHGVVKRMGGRKTFNHPEVGVIELDWDRLTVPGSSGQVLMVYSARPGTRGGDRADPPFDARGHGGSTGLIRFSRIRREMNKRPSAG